MDSGLAFAVAPYEMAVGPVLAVAYWAMRRTSRRFATALVVAGGAAAWWIDVWLIFTNVGDLSGIMDCYPDCSGTQRTAGWFLFLPPVLMAVFIVVLSIASVVGSARARRNEPLHS